MDIDIDMEMDIDIDKKLGSKADYCPSAMTEEPGKNGTSEG